MIAVTRKHSLFSTNHNHTHTVFSDSIEIGQIYRQGDRWILEGFIRMYVAVNDDIFKASTYDKISLGIEQALNRFNKADELMIKSLLIVPLELEKENSSKQVSNRAQTCNPVINLNTGVVYPSARIAAEANGIHLQQMKNVLRIRHKPVWAWYAKDKHNAILFYNQ